MPSSTRDFPFAAYGHPIPGSPRSDSRFWLLWGPHSYGHLPWGLPRVKPEQVSVEPPLVQSPGSSPFSAGASFQLWQVLGFPSLDLRPAWSLQRAPKASRTQMQNSRTATRGHPTMTPGRINFVLGLRLPQSPSASSPRFQTVPYRDLRPYSFYQVPRVSDPDMEVRPRCT